MSKYLIGAASKRPLSREKQIALAREYVAGGRTSVTIRNRLVATNLLLVVRLANRIAPAGYDHDQRQDLIQAGVEGLIHALQKYDPEKGIALTTYAGFWIRSAMARHLLRTWRLVRWGKTPRQVKLWYRLHREEGRLLAEIGEAPLPELAARLGVTEADVREAMAFMGGDALSLSTRRRRGDGEGRASIQDELSDPQATDPEAAAIEAVDAGWVWASIEKMGLKPRAREVLLRRMDGEMTEAIGADLGLTRARVQQIEAETTRLITKRLRLAAERGRP